MTTAAATGWAAVGHDSPTMTETTGTTDEAPSADQPPAGDEDAESGGAPATATSTYRDLPPVIGARSRRTRTGPLVRYIEGGDDPDPETRRREARYRRLLIGMIVLIVGLGLIVTIVGLIVPGVG